MTNLNKDIKYTSRMLNDFPSKDSPFQYNVMSAVIPLNSIIEHPYKDGLSHLGVPVGLVLSNTSVQNLQSLTDNSMSREIARGGGSSIPNLIPDKLYDTLFDEISVSRSSGKKTRKNRK